VNQNKFDTLDDVCAKHVIHTLTCLKYNKTQTAKALDIGLRTLQRNLKKWEAEGKIVLATFPKETEYDGTL
jgi:ActR/RegA family two-component response regulator